MNVKVPFAPGRADALASQTDVASFALLEPRADAFRNYAPVEGLERSPTDLMVDRADQLALTVPEMTVLLGGMRVVVIDENQINQIEVPVPDDLGLVVLTPKFSMPTEKSRKSLPTQLSRQDVIHNTGRIAILIAAITQRNYDLLHIGVQDILHQPPRSRLFPAMYDLFEVARSAGAYAAYLSGGGSSVAAFVNKLNSSEVVEAMIVASEKYDLGAKVTMCSMGGVGAELLSIE